MVVSEISSSELSRLAAAIEAVADRLEQHIRQAPELIRVGIETHEREIPHSGIDIKTSAIYVKQLAELGQFATRMIDFFEGPLSVDYLGREGGPSGKERDNEKGMLKRFDKIEESIMGPSILKVKLPKPAWVGLATVGLSVIYEMLTR